MMPSTNEDMKPDTQEIATLLIWSIFPVSHPSNEMWRPCVGFSDAIPHSAAGHLNEPPMSLPTPRIDPPPPIKLPSPPDEPPHSRSGSYGLPIKPNNYFDLFSISTLGKFK